MILWTLCSIVAAPLTGQDPLFTEVHEGTTEPASGQTTLYYFHLPTCGPCKRMDREVLSDSAVRSFLADHFHLISVFGLDSLTHAYRREYEVSTNPCFLFQNDSGEIIHRLVGFMDKDQFIRECQKVLSGSNLGTLESRYLAGERSPALVSEYLYAMDRANRMDSVTAMDYLESLTDAQLEDRPYLEDLMRYGFYQKTHWVQYGTRLYQTLKKVYAQGMYPEYQEALRVRLLFPLVEYLQGQPFEADIQPLIAELRQLENGKMNAILNLEGTRYLKFLVDTYPSFTLLSKSLKAKGDLEGLQALREEYEQKPGFQER